MVERSNTEWVSELRLAGPAREAALADLRTIIVSGLRFALTNWLDTNGPAFDSLAEDVAQETLLKVLAHLDSFEGRSRFTTWTHKIAVRVALTELRRRRWKDVSLDNLLETEQGEANPDMARDSGPGPETMAERTEILSRLQHMLDEELTEKQRRALLVASTSDLPLEEVARRLGTERNALYKLLHDARLKLKRRLARDGLSPAEVMALFDVK